MLPGTSYPADLFFYLMSTNTLLQITDTTNVSKQLNDISVLPIGDIRLVWATDDGLFGERNVYDMTFAPPQPVITKVVFSSNRDGNLEIYAMNADGTGVTRLTNHPPSDISPD